MKITKIRHIDGDKVETHTLGQLQQYLMLKFARAGFISDVEIETNTKMKIGLHMRSFRIDTEMLGYNADTGRWARARCKKGYKRTSTPTWDQRVEFNHIINRAFNHFSLNANIKSGDVEVRSYDHGAIKSWNHYMSAWGERCYYEISTEKEIIQEDQNEKRRLAKLTLIQGGAA